METDGHSQKDGHHHDECQEEGVLSPEEGHGAVMDLIGEIGHDPASRVLTFHVPVDQEGDRKAQSPQDPGPFG